jgi:[acyl-carrier-protein] S-malonyltransferase
MTHYSLLFPGQGSQYVGMGKSYFETAVGTELIAGAEDILQIPLRRLMLEGPLSDLTQTAVAQPAILLHSYLAFKNLISNYDLPISSMLGHSLGEYSALVAAGVLDIKDALLVVHKRGLLMQDATPAGTGAMAAVLGLDADKIISILKELNNPDQEAYAACANFNGPAQTVIAGTKIGIARATELLKLGGAKRIIELDVSAPFHCALMRPVQQKMTDVLDTIKFDNAHIPVISNVSAQPETKGERIKKLLIEQIASPVRFTECVAHILQNNMSSKFIELGPKNTLSGIVKKIQSQVSTASIDNIDDRI